MGGAYSENETNPSPSELNPESPSELAEGSAETIRGERRIDRWGPHRFQGRGGRS
ncbi:hypothetical protein A2U01_0092738, partial [Trifolium medium]|nr:hypothetical protein [Trifolium medium]